MHTNEQPVASPCISQCKLDGSGRYCTGCLRTLDEIRGWSRADNGQKRAALARIAALSQPRPHIRQLACQQCGKQFRCGDGGRDGACWCSDLPPLLPATGGGDCLCPGCLQQRLSA